MAQKEYQFNFNFPKGGLQDRSIIVAGGTGGLGAALTFLLASEGARVVAGFRSNSERAEKLQEELEERFSNRISLVRGDIADIDVREALLKSAGSAEPPYGLACYTGNPARVAFDEANEEDLLDSLRANYTSPLLLVRDVALRMQEEGQAGSIVLISSMQAVAAFDSSVSYAGPKAALNHAIRILAKQWGGPNGIRVNGVALGVNEAGMALESISKGKYDYFVNAAIISRFGRPEDTARVVRLLLEPDNYVTGEVITVDGGLTLRRDRRRSQ